MKSKDRLLKVLAAAAAAIIVVFFASEIYSLTARSYTTQIVYEQTVLETVDADMFIIRNETLLSSSSSGVTVPLAENAERVSKGSSIAAFFPSEASAENYVKSLALQSKLETYQKIAGQLRLADVDMEKLTAEIDSDFKAITDSAYLNDYSSLEEDKLAFSEKLSRKQISLGRDVDCSAKIAEIQNQISALSSSSVPTEIITAESSGYYVSKADGYENILTVDDIDALTEEQLEKAMKAEKAEVSAASIGKVIDGYNWYIATVTDTAKATEFSKEKTVSLIFGDTDEEKVSAYIHSVKAIDGNRSLVVFRCNLMNDKLASLRKVHGKIVVNEYTGLKVNRDAVRLDENGKSGVYVRRGNIVNFRSVNIIYSEDSFIIASKPESGDGTNLDYPHLKLYDEVIISGKELKDGMVI